MLTWWHGRKERQQQVLRDADNLLALFGDAAYSEALARVRQEDVTGGDLSHRLAEQDRTRETYCCSSDCVSCCDGGLAPRASVTPAASVI